MNNELQVRLYHENDFFLLLNMPNFSYGGMLMPLTKQIDPKIGVKCDHNVHNNGGHIEFSRHISHGFL